MQILYYVVAAMGSVYAIRAGVPSQYDTAVMALLYAMVVLGVLHLIAYMSNLEGLYSILTVLVCVIISVICFVGYAEILLNALVNPSLLSGALLISALFIGPVFMLALSFIFDGWIGPSVSRDRSLINFGFWLSLSVVLTLGAIFLGRMAWPGRLVQPTWQIISANALFDGLTMVVILSLLRAACRDRNRFGVGLAIVIASICAALFACAALWLCFLGTAHYLTWTEVAHVFVGLAPDGSRVELGSLFWLMHTTFVPTLMVLLTILACWVAAGLVRLYLFVVRRGGQGHVDPINMSIALCGVFVALFTGLAAITDVLDEAPKEPSSIRPDAAPRGSVP